MVHPSETDRDDRVGEEVVGWGSRDAARPPSQLDGALSTITAVHGEAIARSGSHLEADPAGGLTQFPIVIAGHPDQPGERIAQIDPQGGVEVAADRFEGHHARERGAPLIPDGVATAALAMVGFAGFARGVDRASGNRASIARQLLGRDEGVIGRHGDRFIEQPAPHRREGDVEAAVFIDLLGGVDVRTIRIAAVELTDHLLFGIEER